MRKFWGDTHALRGTIVYGRFFGYWTLAAAELAEETHAELNFAIAAQATPSGCSEDTVLDHVADAVSWAIGDGCDALFLDLHGLIVADCPQANEVQALLLDLMTMTWERRNQFFLAVESIESLIF